MWNDDHYLDSIDFEHGKNKNRYRIYVYMDLDSGKPGNF
jgi:hypothetical protein